MEFIEHGLLSPPLERTTCIVQFKASLFNWMHAIDDPSELRFQLQTLACGDYLSEIEVLFLLCWFLPTQQSLKRLEIYAPGRFYIPTGEIPMGLCP